MSTEKSRPIEGYRQPQEAEKEKPVDAEKFAEEMKKVRESDPSEQRKKRNLKKEEEGEESEIALTDQPLPSPGEAFTSLMSEGHQDEKNILAIQNPSNAKKISSPKGSEKQLDFEEAPPPSAKEQIPTPSTEEQLPPSPSPSSESELPPSSYQAQTPTQTPSAPQTPTPSPTPSAKQTPSSSQEPTPEATPLPTPQTPSEKKVSQAPAQTKEDLEKKQKLPQAPTPAPTSKHAAEDVEKKQKLPQAPTPTPTSKQPPEDVEKKQKLPQAPTPAPTSKHAAEDIEKKQKPLQAATPQKSLTPEEKEAKEKLTEQQQPKKQPIAEAEKDLEQPKTEKQKTPVKKPKDTSLIKEQKPSFDAYLREKKDKAMADLAIASPQKSKEKKIPAQQPAEVKPQDKTEKPVEEKKPKLATSLPSKKITAQDLEGAKIHPKEALLQPLSKEQKPQKQQPPSVEKQKEESQKIMPPSYEQKEFFKDRDESKRDLSKEQKIEELGETSQVLPIQAPSAPLPVPEASPVSQLDPQVYELFEKMVGLMTIEQHKDLTTISVTIHMKESVFDGAQITLEHFASAPQAFNLQLAGSPQAQALFNANIDDLAAAFASSKYAFEVNIKKPILLEESRLFSRKEKTSRDNQQDKK